VVRDYFQKISGLILDRIDLVALLSLSSNRKIGKQQTELQFQEMKRKVTEGREFALKQFKTLPSRLSPVWLEENLPEKPEIETLLGSVTSLRARHKILRVARSIQALEKSPDLKVEHVFESKAHRFIDSWLESVPQTD